MNFQEKYKAIYQKYVDDHQDQQCTGFNVDASSPMDMLVHTENGDVSLKVDLSTLTYKIADSVTYAVDEEEKPHKIKGRFTGFLGMVLTVLYAVYIISYFGDQSMSNLGGYLASQVVMPHMLCVSVSACLSLVGFFGKKRWAMLACAILMVVSGVVMTLYFPMVIIQAILFFISYARMK